MWSEQDKVAKWPVPPLEQTLSSYLQYLRPLVSAASDSTVVFSQQDYAITERKVKSFLADARQGPLLQRKLIELDQEIPNGCWIEGFWKAGYEEFRGALPLNINPGFVLDKDAARNDLVSRAASITGAAARYARLVLTAALPPSRLNPKDESSAPLCSSQFPASVGSARIPLPNRDAFFVASSPKHVVFITSKNRYYAVDVIDSRGRVASNASIRAAIEELLRLDNEQSTPHLHHHCGPLTAGNRDSWAALRRELLDSDPATNGHTLSTIDSALVVVCLDDTGVAPTTPEQLVLSSLHGDGRENRWYDKNVQFIVSRNGEASVNMEHTGYDGTALLRLVDYVWTNRDGPSSSSSSPTDESVAGAPVPLGWTLAPKHIAAIRSAQHEHDVFARSMQNHSLRTDIGKKFMVSKRLSPDALVQFAYQLAFFSINGRFGSTYESLMMRHFKHGRTETLRPITEQSAAFVRALLAGHATRQQLVDASNAHNARAKECQRGAGIDRHLYAMKMLAAHEHQRNPDFEVPNLFTDKSYKTLVRSELSTSNCGGVGIQWFGFGPVEADGLGLGYAIFDDEIHINITSWQGQADAFAQSLTKSFDRITDFLKLE